MTKKRIIIFSALFLALIGSGFFWLSQRKPELKWRTAAVECGPIQVSVTATGTVQAVVTVQVGTQVSGTIAALYADFNSKVKKGQIIARLDSTLLQAALRDAKSGMSRIHAQHRQTTEALKRTQALFERSLVSQAELDQAKADAEVAEANLGSVRAQVERAQINLDHAVIESPIDGIVLSRAVDVGQTVAASFSTPTLFTLAGDLREMRVQAAVDEADIGKVKQGQKAAFTVDAYPDTLFSGVVEQVRLQPKTEQNVVTYDVLIRVPNPGLRLMPGMTANLTIAVARKEDVLLVPSAALRFQPPRLEKSRNREGKKRRGDSDSPALKPEGWTRNRENPGEQAEPSGRIFILENGKPQHMRVKIGLSDGSKTEIEGGLEPGASVIVGMENGEGKPAGTPFGLPTNQGGRRRM